MLCGVVCVTLCFLFSWRGDEAVRELRSAGISPESFHILLECSNKVRHGSLCLISFSCLAEIVEFWQVSLCSLPWEILLVYFVQAVGAASNPDEDKSYLSGRAAKALEGKNSKIL